MKRLKVVVSLLLCCVTAMCYSANATEGIKMSIEVVHLREYVVRPALKRVGLWSPEAEDLLILTAAVESGMGYSLVQHRGPALGIFQMEPRTHGDIWENYLEYKRPLMQKVVEFTLPEHCCVEDQLTGNLFYAAVMARIHYLRVPAALPSMSKDKFRGRPQYIAALAQYWKDHYNTHKGRGTVKKAVEAYYAFGCDEGHVGGTTSLATDPRQ